MITLVQWQRSLAGMIDADGLPRHFLGSAMTVPGPTVEQGGLVYRSSSRGARAMALQDIYPVCRRLLGDRSFDGLAREFVRRQPSTSGDLNRYGDGFAGFVRGVVDEQPAFGGLPWLGDLVDLEWLFHSLYHRDDSPPFDPSPLASEGAERLSPRPASHIAWMHSRWPVHKIWRAHADDADPDALHIEPGSYRLLCERRDYRSVVRVIDPVLWQLLDVCGQGYTLAQMAMLDGLRVDRLGELVELGWIGTLERKADDV